MININKDILIIDCQVLQTSAWTRGMGRYLVSLIMGVYQNNNPPKVLLVFNDKLELTKDCEQVLQKVAPDAERVFLSFQKGLSYRVERTNSRILDSFVKDRDLEGAIFINGSIFSFDYQPAFPSTTYNTCIFYDMIPMKRWDIFYKYFPEQEYFSRFKYLYMCERIFAISEAVKRDLIDVLGFSEEKSVNISGAEIPHFMGELSGENTDDRPLKLYRYILLPGGNSPHKNMLRAIRAFDEFNGQFGDSFKLVITSFYSAENIERMQRLSPNIELVGNVKDAVLHNLYKYAEAVMFPSLDEGLGLPILEAVGYRRKVACSNIKVFKEFSKDAFYFFDPLDTASMSQALTAAITNEDWSQKQNKYAHIQQTFTWQNTASRLLAGLGAAKSENSSVKVGRVALIVEQTGDGKALKDISKYLSGHNLNSATLFIDELSERRKKPDQLPLITKYFVRHYDIADAPIKSKGSEAVVILTKDSKLSIPLGLSVNARFVGSKSLVRRAVNNLLAGTQLSDSENARDAIQAKVMQAIDKGSA